MPAGFANFSTGCGADRLELEDVSFEVFQIHDANGVETPHVPGTLAGVEQNLGIALFVAVQVSMTVQRKINAGVQMFVEVKRVMDNHDRAGGRDLDVDNRR